MLRLSVNICPPVAQTPISVIIQVVLVAMTSGLQQLPGIGPTVTVNTALLPEARSQVHCALPATSEAECIELCHRVI